MKKSLLTTLAIVASLTLTACLPSGSTPAVAPPSKASVSTAAEPLAGPEPLADPEPALDPEPKITFVSIIDGDTIETSAGKVRIIGIDTPEQGQCGHSEASMSLGAVLMNGAEITLELPEGQNDTDRYDRLLRYVYAADGTDIGMLQIEAGHAVARFDSRDGYPWHPKETQYRDAQVATLGANGVVESIVCVQPQTPPAASPPAPAEDDAPWYMQYSSCTKLKKNTVGHPRGPFNVNDPAELDIYNWFAYGTGNRGDGDGDGLACE